MPSPEKLARVGDIGTGIDQLQGRLDTLPLAGLMIVDLIGEGTLLTSS